VICPSSATFGDLVDMGFDERRIRVVPWGVEASPVTDADVAAVRATYALPDRFVLYVAVPGTKTNSRLYAIDSRTELVPADGIPIWRAPDLKVDTGTGTLYVACQQSVDAFVGVLVVEPAR